MRAVDVADQRRHPFRLAGIAVAIAVLVLGLAAIVLFLWLRTYAPLSAAGSFAPGPGVKSVLPGRKPTFVTGGKDFVTAFTLHNSGRFATTIRSLEPSAGAVELQTTDSSTASADPSHLHAFQPIRLDPGDSALLVVRWRLTCPAQAIDDVRLRYRYLSMFTRTERIRLPFAVSPRCATPVP